MKLALAISALVLGSAGIGAVLLQPAHAVRVEVLDMADPHGTDRITWLHVRLHNDMDQPVRPAFAVPGNALVNWYNWPITSGPESLPPHTAAEYTITQLPYTGVDIGNKFRVVVHDIDQQLVIGSTDLVQANTDTPRVAVLNPGFQAWQPSMFAQSQLPYGWVPFHRLHGQDQFAVSGEDGQLTLTLAPDADRQQGVTSEVALRQRIDFPQSLRIEFSNGTRGDYAAGAFTMSAVSLEDVHAKRQLVVIFSEDPTDSDQAAINAFEQDGFESVRILVTNRTVHLDVEDAWRQLGWDLPARQAGNRLHPTGPGNVGFGSPALEHASQKFDLVRPIELRVFVASTAPAEHDTITATFAYVGGPALEPAASRF